MDVGKMRDAIGVTAEMAIIFFRATVDAGADTKEATLLTQAYLAAMIYGQNKGQDNS